MNKSIIMKKINNYFFFTGIFIFLSACSGINNKQVPSKVPEVKDKIHLITLDPGHFHAALIQKTMYKGIDSTVYVYAPEGIDVEEHLKRIEAYNTRKDDPTCWTEKVYTGKNYLQKMLADKSGNVVILSGNNSKKIKYIKASVDAGINVFADKPLAINSSDFLLLKDVMKLAGDRGVVVDDIMTERYEITNILQRELSKDKEIFGILKKGTAEHPAVVQQSIHHFFKYVSGKPNRRPSWYFDTAQQGEGIVDVTTHLIDMIQWETFPDKVLHKSDVQMIDAKHWATKLTLEQFKKVTGLKEYPEFLQKDVKNGQLNILANGYMVYKLRDKYIKVSVVWNFEAPEGKGDTYCSIMHGTLCDLTIKQDEKNDQPTVYISCTKAYKKTKSFEEKLKKKVRNISLTYPGLKLVKKGNQEWILNIPEKYRVGEAHFAQATMAYFNYIKEGNLPDWEIPNMMVKYYTTTQALKMAEKK